MDTKLPSRPFPSLWKTFERIINGKVRQFWVQDLPEEHFELALDYLCDYFLQDEPMCRTQRILEDKIATACAREFWKGMIAGKCSLACYTKLENGENKLVAVNCCLKKTHGDDYEDKRNNMSAEIMKKTLDILEYVSDLKDPFQEFGITGYLGAMGLVVMPEYRGHNIGLEVLHARRPFCKVLGLKASITLFTSPASQRLAEKAGFKDLVVATFDEIEEKNPSFKIPNINALSKCIRNMYILY